MNNITITPSENLCRTCMGEEEPLCKKSSKRRKTISIFNVPKSMENSNITIMELLLLTTAQLNVEKDDMLPKILCESCVDRLIKTYDFQQMCIRVEQSFRDQIMMNEEKPVANNDQIMMNEEKSVASNDPLNDNMVTQTINDLSNILKIEVDEPLIDHDVSTAFNNKIVDNNDVNDDPTDSIKSETDNSDWADNAFSDKDSEWEFHMFDKDSKKLNTKTILKKQKERRNADNSEGGDKDSECKSQMIVKRKKRNTKITLKKQKEDAIETSNQPDSFKDELAYLEHNTKEITHESNINPPEANKKEDEEKLDFVCDECGNRLKTRKSLKRHKRIHLRPPGVSRDIQSTKTKYECEFCQKIFQQSSSLKDHLRIHTGEQPYLCSECGKAFKSLSNMKQHFLRHGTDRPYECPDCPKRFPCLSDLASHKAVHNKTKSHVCDVCGAAFVKPYLLKKHKMYHTGEKNHKCDYCDMRFVLADQCRRHMRTHTGEKPYKCKYCERAFAQSNDLIKHLRGHLGDNVYKCDLCPQGFRLQGDLRSHFNTHKNDDDETRLRNLQALRDEELRLQMKFGILEGT